MRVKHLILMAAVLVGLTVSMAAQASAEVMWNWTDPDTSITYTVIEATPFYEGGTAGNTVDMDDSGTYWATLDTETTGKWNFRTAFAYDFNVLGGSPASDPDVFESCRGGAPNLRTTITGLDDGLYDVFLVEGLRNDAGGENLLYMKADLDTGQAAPTTDRKRTDAGVVWTGYQGSGGNHVFEFVLSPLGQVTGMGFSVLAGESDYGSSPDRSHYVGVAYRLVPEPGTLALLATGLIGLLCYAWRKRK